MFKSNIRKSDWLLVPLCLCPISLSPFLIHAQFFHTTMLFSLCTFCLFSQFVPYKCFVCVCMWVCLVAWIWLSSIRTRTPYSNSFTYTKHTYTHKHYHTHMYTHTNTNTICLQLLHQLIESSPGCQINGM